MSFPMMDFPLDHVSLSPLFTDAELLSQIHSQGKPDAFLPKVEKTYGKVIFPAGIEYPYIYSSIALSMDGKMAYPDNLDGDMLVHSNRSNPKGAEADFFVLNFLRAYSDAILIGTASMKAEANEWVTCFDQQLVDERIAHLGKREQPFVIIATRDGKDLPGNHMLLHQNKLPVVIFTSESGWTYLKKTYGDTYFLLENFTEDAIWNQTEGNAVVVTGTGDNTDIRAFMHLMRKAGVRQLLNESPTFMWLLMQEGLMNEFFITHSSIFVGGPMTPGLNAPFTFDTHPESKIVQLNRHGNTFIYSRQLIQHAR